MQANDTPVLAIESTRHLRFPQNHPVFKHAQHIAQILTIQYKSLFKEIYRPAELYPHHLDHSDHPQVEVSAQLYQ